MYILTDTSL